MGRLEEYILQCLIIDGRATFRRISEVIGVSEQTVARRYRQLVESGQARVFAIPSGFGDDRRAWWVRIRCRPDATLRLAEALAVRSDVSWVALMSGGSEINCRIAGPVGSTSGSVLSGLPRTGAVLSFSAQILLRSFATSTADWTMFDEQLDEDQVAALRRGKAHSGGPAGVLSDEDAPLLALLARDGRASVAVLARHLGWPSTRVSARLEALLSAGALHLATDFLPESFGYHASAQLYLTVPPERIIAIGETLASMPATGFVAATSGSENLMATVTCRTYDDLFRYVTEDVGAFGDVRGIELVPYQQRIKQSKGLVVEGRLLPTEPA